MFWLLLQIPTDLYQKTLNVGLSQNQHDVRSLQALSNQMENYTRHPCSLLHNVQVRLMHEDACEFCSYQGQAFQRSFCDVQPTSQRTHQIDQAYKKTRAPFVQIHEL